MTPGPGRPSRSLWRLAMVACAATAALIAAPANGPLTATPWLVRVYDQILNASFDEAAASIASCAAPGEACLVL